MRKLVFLFLVVAAFTTSCKDDDCRCVPPPLGSSLTGNWELVRINSGFGNKTMIPSELGYTERLNFSANGHIFSRYRDEQIVENTPFVVSMRGNSTIITFKEDTTYTTYDMFLENDRTMISLYARTRVGTVVADGSTYYYQKIGKVIN